MTRRTILFIRWGVFLAACTFLFVRLAGHQSMHAVWLEWRAGAGRMHGLSLAIVCALMVVNWGIEAWKWQGLMRPVERISLMRAFAATIAGTSIGLITPNRVGEFAGRVLFLEPEHRVQGGFATALGSIAQFVATLLAGSIALPFLPTEVVPDVSSTLWSAFQLLMALLAAAALVCYFLPRWLEAAFMIVPFLRRYRNDAQVLDRFGRGELIRVLGLSLLRYVVFTVQFGLVLHVLADVPYATAFVSVPVVFLFTTLLPTMMLTELGVRGSVATALIPGVESLVLLSTFIVWVINLAVPALMGSLVLLLARIRTAQGTA